MELMTNDPTPSVATLWDTLHYDISTGAPRPLRGIDIICSSIQQSGVDQLRPLFRLLEARRVPVRILTSTLPGTSQPSAIRSLERDFPTLFEIKVVWATESPNFRFNANGWRFHVPSFYIEHDCRDVAPYSLAILGTSNMSRMALTSNLEFNMRVVDKVTGAYPLKMFDLEFQKLWMQMHPGVMVKPFRFMNYEELERASRADSVREVGCDCDHCENMLGRRVDEPAKRRRTSENGDEPAKRRKLIESGESSGANTTPTSQADETPGSDLPATASSIALARQANPNPIYDSFPISVVRPEISIRKPPPGRRKRDPINPEPLFVFNNPQTVPIETDEIEKVRWFLMEYVYKIHEASFRHQMRYVTYPRLDRLLDFVTVCARAWCVIMTRPNPLQPYALDALQEVRNVAEGLARIIILFSRFEDEDFEVIKAVVWTCIVAKKWNMARCLVERGLRSILHKPRLPGHDLADSMEDLIHEAMNTNQALSDLVMLWYLADRLGEDASPRRNEESTASQKWTFIRNTEKEAGTWNRWLHTEKNEMFRGEWLTVTHAGVQRG